jgi:hypothetical protein
LKFGKAEMMHIVVLSRASRARLKAVAKRKGGFEKFLALRLSTGDMLVY